MEAITPSALVGRGRGEMGDGRELSSLSFFRALLEPSGITGGGRGDSWWVDLLELLLLRLILGDGLEELVVACRFPSAIFILCLFLPLT